MNIYFVNRYSKFKGPFDIIDSNREHIIQVGDICLRNTISGVSFLLVRKNENNWNACTQVGIAKTDAFINIGNSLLFSFGATNKRKGNLPLLKRLCGYFQEKSIIELFNNAIDILQYQKDFWDILVFQQLLAPSEIVDNKISEDFPVPAPKSPNYPTVFAKYLNEALLDLLTKTLNEGKSLKEAYAILRNRFPNDFRNALFNFIHEEPNYSIYDKLPDDESYNEIEELDNEEEPDKPVVVCTVHEIKNEPIGKATIGSAVYDEYSNLEIVDLFKRYHAGKKDCYDKIVKANLGLVRTIALQFCSVEDEIFEDILQEGNLGLLKAIEKFDYKKYSDFPNYAKFWIQQSIYVALSSLKYTVRFPVNQMNLHKKLKAYAHNFEQTYGYPPSALDFEMFDLYDLETLNSISQLPDDLKDVTCRVDDLDSFESETHVVEKLVHQEYWRTHIQKLLKYLDEREEFILIKFFGIGTTQETLNSIGDKLNITRERARQILWKAVRRLKKVSGIRRMEAVIGDVIQLDSSEKIGKVIGIRNAQGQTKILTIKLDSGKTEEITVIGTPYDIIHKKDKSKKKTIKPRAVEIAKQKKELIKANTSSNKPSGRHYFNEYNGLCVGDKILYKRKKYTVMKILGDEYSSRLLIENEKGLLDWISNDKSKYEIITSKYTIDNRPSRNKSNRSNSVRDREAYIGDKIIYNNRICTVRNKKTIKGSLRLIVEYDDGNIDNIPNDWNLYQVIDDKF